MTVAVASGACVLRELKLQAWACDVCPWGYLHRPRGRDRRHGHHSRDVYDGFHFCDLSHQYRSCQSGYPVWSASPVGLFPDDQRDEAYRHFYFCAMSHGVHQIFRVRQTAHRRHAAKASLLQFCSLRCLSLSIPGS